MKTLMAVLVILLLLLQYNLWFQPASVADALRLKKAIAKQESLNLELKTRNDALLAEVKDLKRGHDAIEAHARRDLGMVKQDEIFFQIVKRKHDKS